MALADELQERIKGKFPELLGVTFLDATPDCVKAELKMREEVTTVTGIVHGGALMAFADTLGATATIINMPADCRTTTIESKTNFFRASRTDGKVIGTCTPLHKGRTTQVWQTRITDENDKLCAQIIQTQIVIPAG
jgi:uncharacterized protein (TIGR00369 family)